LYQAENKVTLKPREPFKEKPLKTNKLITAQDDYQADKVYFSLGY